MTKYIIRHADGRFLALAYDRDVAYAIHAAQLAAGVSCYVEVVS